MEIHFKPNKERTPLKSETKHTGKTIHRLMKKHPAPVEHSKKKEEPPKEDVIEYGQGSDPSHYYIGMTPKDVILATKGPHYERVQMISSDSNLFDNQQTLNTLIDLTQGKLPTNNELLRLLKSFRHSLVEQIQHHSKLEPECQKVLTDCIEITDILTVMLDHYNEDEVLQGFVHHSLLASYISKEQGDESMSTLLFYGINNLVNLVLTGNFRETIKQLASILSEFSVMEEMEYETQTNEIPVRRMTLASTPSIQDQIAVKHFKRRFVMPSFEPVMEKIRLVLMELQKSPRKQRAFQLLMKLLSEAPGKYHDTIRIIDNEENRFQMLRDLKTIIERFACGTSFDTLLDMLESFQDHARRDWELRELWEEVKRFVKLSLQDVYFVDSELFVFRGSNILKRFSTLLQSRYSKFTNDFLTEVEMIVQSFQQHKLSNDFLAAVSSLIQDVMIDPLTGKFTLKAKVLKEIRSVFFPVLNDTIRFIPLPRIELTSDSYDLTLDQIILVTQDLLPNLVEVTVTNTLQSSTLKSLPGIYYTNMICIDVIQIRVNIRDIDFQYNKKNKPKMFDQGKMDIYLGGEGLRVTMKVGVDLNLKQSHFFPLEVKATMDDFKISTRDTKHGFLFKTFGKSMTHKLKKRICSSIEENITSMIHSLDDFVIENVSEFVDDYRREYKGANIW